MSAFLLWAAMALGFPSAAACQACDGCECCRCCDTGSCQCDDCGCSCCSERCSG
jgi:hypothetical protein